MLAECVLKAHAGFLSKYAELRADQTIRTDRSAIHDQMVKEIKAVFGDGKVPGFTCTHSKRYNLFLLNFKDKYLIKPKKLNERLRSSNNPTQLVLDFLGQLTSPRLPGLDPTHLHLGYQPMGATGTSQPRVWIVCPNKNRKPHWVWELETEGIVVPLTPAAEPEVPVFPTERVVLREPSEEVADEVEETADDNIPPAPGAADEPPGG